MRWVAGARVDKFDFLEGAILSPRTALLLKPAPVHTLRLSYNRAYMAPSAIQSYYQTVFVSQFNLGQINPQFAGQYIRVPRP